MSYPYHQYTSDRFRSVHMTHYHHKIPWEVTDRLQREEIGANMPREAQNGGSRCRRCFQTPCIREIRHSLTHIPTLPSVCDPTLGVRRRRSSGKLPVIEDGISGSRDPSHSFFQGQISLTRMVDGVRANAIAVLSFLCFHALNPKPEFLTNGAVHFLRVTPTPTIVIIHLVS